MKGVYVNGSWCECIYHSEMWRAKRPYKCEDAAYASADIFRIHFPVIAGKDKIKKSVRKYLMPILADNTRTSYAKYKNDAGMLGVFYHFAVAGV